MTTTAKQNNRMAGRPLKGEQKRVRVSFTLDPKLAAWLQGQADFLGKSRSDLLDLAILEAQKNWGSPLESRVRIPVATSLLKKFCQKNHIKKLSLFGSVLTERFGPESDIDILVEFEQGHTPSLFGMVAMEAQLSEIFGGRKIDLKTPQELSPYFVNDVLKEAESVYAV